MGAPAPLYRSILALVALCLAPLATAAPLPFTLSTADHDGDGLPSGNGADTFIAEHEPNENYGDDVAAGLHFSDSFLLRRSSVVILRFDVSAIDDLASLGTAALRIFDRQSGDGNRELDDLMIRAWVLTDESEDAWSEGAITWNDGAPAHEDDGDDYNGPDLTGGALPIGLFEFADPDGDGWSEPVLLGNAITEAILRDTNGLVTVLLSSDSENLFESEVGTKEGGLDEGARLDLSTDLPPQPANPDYGYGTPGGAGGAVIKVTNLNASGGGSLRAALETSGARIVVFEVGGVINLGGSTLTVDAPFLTIAGQTAPDPGITLIRGGVLIRTHDVILQHLAVRTGENGRGKGSGWEVDAISTRSRNGNDAYNVVVDHCSVSWGTDENLSAGGTPDGEDGISRNITFSNNIIAEGLFDSTHSKGEHSMGSLVLDDNQHIAFIRNVFAHNNQRNPQFKGGTTGVILNNLVYNPGDHAMRVREQGDDRNLGKPVAAVVGNLLLPGRDTDDDDRLVDAPDDEGGRLFVRDNWSVDDDDVMTPVTYDREIDFLEFPAAMPARFRPLLAQDVLAALHRDAGTRPGKRNPTDTRLLEELLNRTGGIIDSESEVGGYPSVMANSRSLTVPSDGVEGWLRSFEAEVSNPGLPAWTARHFTIPERFDHTVSGLDADPDGDGHPNFEELAFGGNPREPDPIPAQKSLLRLPDGLELRFVRTEGVDADVKFSLQASATLEGWTEVPSAGIAETVLPSGDGLEEVRWTFANENRSQYFRVEARGR